MIERKQITRANNIQNTGFVMDEPVSASAGAGILSFGALLFGFLYQPQNYIITRPHCLRGRWLCEASARNISLQL